MGCRQDLHICYLQQETCLAASPICMTCNGVLGVYKHESWADSALSLLNKILVYNDKSPSYTLRTTQHLIEITT